MNPGDTVEIDWHGSWAHGRKFVVLGLETVDWGWITQEMVYVVERFAPDGSHRRHDYAADRGRPLQVKFLFAKEWCRVLRPPTPSTREPRTEGDWFR